MAILNENGHYVTEGLCFPALSMSDIYDFEGLNMIMSYISDMCNVAAKFDFKITIPFEFYENELCFKQNLLLTVFWSKK